MLCATTLAPARAGEPVALFDGKDTARWYTFLRDHGKDKDPNGNFTVRDGLLRIAGVQNAPAAIGHTSNVVVPGVHVQTLRRQVSGADVKNDR